MIRLCLQGASGRMGSQILRVLPEFSDFSLVSVLESPDRARLGEETCAGIVLSSDTRSGVTCSDVVVDFSCPEASLRLAGICAEMGRPLLIGTTGHSAEQLAELEKAAQKTALLLVSNTSPGVFALQKLCAQAKNMLGAGYDVEILETHHRGKKDAPSGTALALARSLSGAGDQEVVLNRASQPRGAAQSEIGIASLRGGDVYGEHSVLFLGTGERLEITHRVSDRGIFARGALRLARDLPGRRPGFYGISDILKT